jgi:hypothetical protein
LRVTEDLCCILSYFNLLFNPFCGILLYFNCESHKTFLYVSLCLCALPSVSLRGPQANRVYVGNLSWNVQWQVFSFFIFLSLLCFFFLFYRFYLLPPSPPFLPLPLFPSLALSPSASVSLLLGVRRPYKCQRERARSQVSAYSREPARSQKSAYRRSYYMRGPYMESQRALKSPHIVGVTICGDLIWRASALSKVRIS